MYYHQFHDLPVSALGIGSLRLPAKPEDPNCIDREKAQKVIDYALGHGINFVDTAYTYHEGDSERFLGEALKKHNRSSYYLSSKYYVSANPDIRALFEEQLRRLQTDYLDFYLLHGMDENSFDAFTDESRDYIGFLQEQKRLGRIRYLGFSSHAAPETLSRFLEWYDGFDMALLQLNYLDWKLLNAKRQYEIVTAHNIPIWVMEPMKGGILSSLNPKAAKILKDAAPNRSLASWGFRFLMGLPNVRTILSGMSSIEQIKDNLTIFDRPDPLSSQEIEILEKAADAFLEDRSVPCTGCRYCCSVCPAGLDIPLLIKGYSEHRVSGETWRIAGLSRIKHEPESCLQCGLCLKHCPQKIEIPHIMKQFAAVRK